MDMQQIIEQAERNIRQALIDYAAHTGQTDVVEDCCDTFIRRLAEDSSRAKQGLRELFSQSPVWDAELDALVINGTRTHNPNYERIEELGREILRPVWNDDCYYALRLFTNPDASSESLQISINAINRLAPKAYTPTKKLSRIFKAVCTAVGVADESAGSDFQRMYASFADELTAKKIGFKLYVSINPAHFLTMSNPKCDRRGATLTSCHSFNSTEYSYNNGCTGYARDCTSFIVFTASDPREPETLNNRKTTRQIFAYEPGNGVLLQSRMYNTSGGVYGKAEDSQLYRDLVQREISILENMPNLWKTFPYLGDHSYCVEIGDGFGGYADWTYSDFDGKVSIRHDHENDHEGISVGTHGLCVACGDETCDGVYCDDCKDEGYTCDHCNSRCSETYEVVDSRGNEIYVCEDCRNDHYRYCKCCERYVYEDNGSYVCDSDEWVCDSCLDEYYEECPECEEFHHRDNMRLVHDNSGDEIHVCENCRDEHYRYCDQCEEYYPEDDTHSVHFSNNGYVICVCDNCVENYTICPECEEYIEVREDGTCPSCGSVVEGNDKEEEQ